jgi:hypothetical protein
MSFTSDDLRDFQQFAAAKLSCGPADSLVKLAGEWEAAQKRREAVEADETLADIRASHADINAGRVLPLSDAFGQVREQLGLK